MKKLIKYLNWPSTPNNNYTPWWDVLRRGIMLPLVYSLFALLCLGLLLFYYILYLSHGKKDGTSHFDNFIGCFKE